MVGGGVRTAYVHVATALSAYDARKAPALTAVGAVTAKGVVYAVELVVGVEPSVV
jgi:hypothetical protein